MSRALEVGSKCKKEERGENSIGQSSQSKESTKGHQESLQSPGSGSAEEEDHTVPLLLGGNMNMRL